MTLFEIFERVFLDFTIKLIATKAKLIKSSEKNIAISITARFKKLRLPTTLELLMNIPPALMYVGRGANNGIRNAITKGIEKNRTNLRLLLYV